MNRTYLLLKDQVTFQVLGAENLSMHNKRFSLIQNDSRCSTIARGFIRIPLPKAVNISAPNTSAIYLISLDPSYKIDISFTAKKSHSGIWLVDCKNHFPPFVNLVLSVELRGDSSSSDHLSASSPTAKIVSPSNDCLTG